MKTLLAIGLSTLLAFAATACGTPYEPVTGGGPADGPGLLGIGVGPQGPTVTIGETIQFTATGFYDDQETRDITDSVDWYSTNTSVLEVSDSLDSEGSGETFLTGQSKVYAEYRGVSSNEVRVVVTGAVVDELALSPATVSLHQGERVQLQAQASFSDGSHGNVSGSVLWTTDDGSVATVNSSGEVKAEGVGSTAITGLYQSGNEEFESEPTFVTVLDGDVVIDDADLRIVGFSASSTDQLVSYSVQVKNSGGSPASGFWVDAWVNRSAAPPTPPTSGDGGQLVDLLGPGETTSVTVNVEGISPGNYSSWLMVDGFNAIPEGSLGENNNIWGPEPVSVSDDGGPIGPDLSISYLQAYVQTNQSQVLYIIDVTNTGDETAENFSLGVYSNPSFPPVAPAAADEELPILSLPPGETAYLSLIVRDLPEDYWQSYVLADRANSIAESNESNNLASFQVVR